MGSPSHRYGGSESIYSPDRGEPRDWERIERVQHNPDDLRHSIGARYSGSTRYVLLVSCVFSFFCLLLLVTLYK